MKKSLHILAIIAAGAMIMAATGCASVSFKKAEAVTTDQLAGTEWVKQKKLMGVTWVNDGLLASELRFSANGTFEYSTGGVVAPGAKGTYTIGEWRKIPAGKAIICQGEDVLGIAPNEEVYVVNKGNLLEKVAVGVGSNGMTNTNTVFKKKVAK
ncbi:hypothetical protein FACS1894163_00090 [Spirochaetia bacterium]|nr:hypothetical protein FACS1894163_00090 [Spirochaetia bacterium]